MFRTLAGNDRDVGLPSSRRSCASVASIGGERHARPRAASARRWSRCAPTPRACTDAPRRPACTYLRTL